MLSSNVTETILESYQQQVKNTNHLTLNFLLDFSRPPARSFAIALLFLCSFPFLYKTRYLPVMIDYPQSSTCTQAHSLHSLSVNIFNSQHL